MKYMKELETLKCHNIEYTITLAKTRRLTIKYDKLGILKIRCPKNIMMAELEDFVNRHLDWILKYYDLTRPVDKTHPTGSLYLYLGKEYKIEIINSRHQGVFIKEDKIIVYTLNENNVKSLLNKWRLEQAELIFNELFYKCFKQMENEFTFYPTLKIKCYTSRWGCCYPKKRIVYLNISLIHTSIDLIEFVIYHELSHFKYPNHQIEFHNYLQKYCPNERTLSKKLKKYHADYE